MASRGVSLRYHTSVLGRMCNVQVQAYMQVPVNDDDCGDLELDVCYDKVKRQLQCGNHEPFRANNIKAARRRIKDYIRVAPLHGNAKRTLSGH